MTGRSAGILAVCVVLAFLLAALTLSAVLSSGREPSAPAARLPVATDTRRPAPPRPSKHTPTPAPARRATFTVPAPLPPESCVPAGTEMTVGQVTAVLDGENIEVTLPDGETLTVSFAGITAPPEAAARMRGLLEGQQVVLVADLPGEDAAAGPTRRFVLVDGRLINAVLVREGWARAGDSPGGACAQVLQAAQTEAQRNQSGIWAPTPPPTLTFIATVGYNPGDRSGCDCSVRWVCTDFSRQARAQTCFNACNDYNSRLDEDHDGLACEELP